MITCAAKQNSQSLCMKKWDSIPTNSSQTRLKLWLIGTKVSSPMIALPYILAIILIFFFLMDFPSFVSSTCCSVYFCFFCRGTTGFKWAASLLIINYIIFCITARFARSNVCNGRSKAERTNYCLLWTQFFTFSCFLFDFEIVSLCVPSCFSVPPLSVFPSLSFRLSSLHLYMIPLLVCLYIVFALLHLHVIVRLFRICLSYPVMPPCVHHQRLLLCLPVGMFLFFVPWVFNDLVCLSSVVDALIFCPFDSLLVCLDSLVFVCISTFV